MNMINKIKNHFGLKHIPFSKTISTSDLFVSNGLKRVNERLSLAVANEDFALISGAAGSGKSSAIRYFVSDLDSQAYPYVYITAEKYKIGDVAKLILYSFNTDIPYNGYTALRRVKELITKMNAERNSKPLVIIDEAQELPVSTLSSIKNLANFKIDSQSLITFILCGQNELLNKINMSELASLRRRIRVRYKFGNLSLEETVKYMDHQMSLAGVSKTIFSDDVKSEIFRLSTGAICNINNICYDLLIKATEEAKEIIEPSLIDSILVSD